MKITYTEYKNKANFNKTNAQNFKSLISKLTTVGPNAINVTKMEYILNAVKVGMGQYSPNNLVRKGQAFLTYYEDFFDVGNFLQAESFSEPQAYAYDPTYIAQFSNIIGKIHTNIMFKRLSGGIITFNYEGWAKMNSKTLTGSRPDLVGVDRNNKYFSLESKGWKKNKGNPAKFKAVQQALSVNIGQVSSIAVVSSNLFDKIDIDYIDPPVDGVPEGISLDGLVTKYYEIWQSQVLDDPLVEKIGKIEFIMFDYIVFLNEYHLLGIDKRHLNTDHYNKVEFYEYEQREGESYIDSDGIGVFKWENTEELLFNRLRRKK
ncbi:MAG: hypothetical protein Q4A90_08965 [Streptococcus sp.]|nr:hypothetical protein [Streptococcus sp.]